MNQMTALKGAPGGALADIKVADFSWSASGPITTRNLADHGATVVRVESIAHLDSIRITGPFPNDKPGLNTSGFFADFNSSKYDLALDLSKEEAWGVARRLIEWSDVVVESFTPRVMSRWGLAYEDIVAWKPQIVMLSSSMQGQTGPYREYSGYGSQGAAIAGLHHLTGWPDREPAGPKGAYTDSIAPRYSLAAILAALDYRDRTGRGQHIDLSQIEAAISGFMAVELLDLTVNGRAAAACGNRSRYGHAAPHAAFRCAGDDRWITIAVETDAQWSRLVAVMGHPAWATDENLATLDGRLKHEATIEGELALWFRHMGPFEVVALLQAEGIPAGVVQKASDLFQDPQLAARGHFRPLSHSEMGVLAYNGPANTLSDTPAELRWAAPLLGEHTNHVLKEFLGYSDEEVAGMEARQLLR